MMKLDDITFGNWQVFRMNLTGVVTPYYNKVAAAFSDTEKGVGKLVKEQQERISAMVGLLARMEGKGVTPITRKELKKLENLNVEFRKVHKQVVVWVKESIPFRKDSEKAIKDLGIPPKDVKAADAVSKRPGLERGGVISGIARTLGLRRMVPAVGAGAVAGIVTPMLGPLAGPAAVAAGGLYSVYRMAKGIEGIIKRRRSRLADRQESGLAGMPGVPGLAGAPGVPGLAGMPGLAGTGVVEGIASTYPRDVRGRFVPRGGLTGIDSIEKGLFKFFDKRALKAKWTRRLLRAIEKGGAAGGALGRDLFGSFSKLKLLLPHLLLALGKGAGLVGAVVFTAYHLHKAGKVAKEWWEVHKNVTESIKKQTEKQKELLQDLSDTLMEKVRAAKERGDEPARKKALKGVIEAQKEILEKEPKAGLWKTIKYGAEAVAGDIKRVTGFEEGGVVTRPTLGVIGEGRPEVVTPLSAGNIMDVLKAIKENTARGAGAMLPAPIDTFRPPFDLADPLLNELNRSGSLSVG